MILPYQSINLDSYGLAELLGLRSRIDEKLPSGSLEDINLSDELVRTFLSAKALLEEARNDDETNLSAKSSMINSLNAVLKSLVTLQTDLYSVTRQQRLESALSAALMQHPDLQDSFFAIYDPTPTPPP